MAKKSGKEKRQAPAEWQSAVDASAEKDAPKGGVVHDASGPTILEPLDAETLRIQSHEMARLIGERTKVRDEKLETMRKYNDKLKGFEDRIAELAAEVESGTRRVPAQKTLPGTEAQA
jgi:hypothetical protein